VREDACETLRSMILAYKGDPGQVYCFTSQGAQLFHCCEHKLGCGDPFESRCDSQQGQSAWPCGVVLSSELEFCRTDTTAGLSAYYKVMGIPRNQRSSSASNLHTSPPPLLRAVFTVGPGTVAWREHQRHGG
jgi:hypothetical protein